MFTFISSLPLLFPSLHLLPPPALRNGHLFAPPTTFVQRAGRQPAAAHTHFAGAHGLRPMEQRRAATRRAAYGGSTSPATFAQMARRQPAAAGIHFTGARIKADGATAARNETSSVSLHVSEPLRPRYKILNTFPSSGTKTKKGMGGCLRHCWRVVVAVPPWVFPGLAGLGKLRVTSDRLNSCGLADRQSRPSSATGAGGF